VDEPSTAPARAHRVTAPARKAEARQLVAPARARSVSAPARQTEAGQPVVRTTAAGPHLRILHGSGVHLALWEHVLVEGRRQRTTDALTWSHAPFDLASQVVGPAEFLVPSPLDGYTEERFGAPPRVDGPWGPAGAPAATVTDPEALRTHLLARLAGNPDGDRRRHILDELRGLGDGAWLQRVA
jgi:hypothetical protein